MLMIAETESGIHLLFLFAIAGIHLLFLFVFEIFHN